MWWIHTPETGMLALHVSQEKIDKLKALRAPDWEPDYKALGRVRERQRAFLEALMVVRSPTIACRKVGLAETDYRNWRKTDPEFCEMLNECLEPLREELEAAVYNRAKGYYIMGEDGYYVTDPSGVPIMQGGSDALAIKLLGLDRQERNAKEVTVNIEIVPRGT
jgi:hypothetical protein